VHLLQVGGGFSDHEQRQQRHLAVTPMDMSRAGEVCWLSEQYDGFTYEPHHVENDDDGR
jgi:hypothetical protein